MSGSSFAGRWCVTLVATAVVSFSACRSPAEERAPDARYETIRPAWRGIEPQVSREWLRFSVGFLDRDQAPEDPIGDGVAWGIDGGFDIARTVFTPSVEFGMSFTSAHVALPDTDNVDLWRGTVGMRGTWHADGWRPYVRGGGFLRWSTQELEEPLDPYATGIYAGIGADWPYQDGMWLGPSFTYYRALDEDAPGGEADEFLFALSATFRL